MSEAKHANVSAAGDPAATGVQLPDMTWTIRSDDDFTLTASALQHDSAPCIAYTFTEADRWPDCTTSCETTLASAALSAF
jgi:hypothetical protein